MASLKMSCHYKYTYIKCIGVRLNLFSHEEKYNLIFNSIGKYFGFKDYLKIKS